MSLLLGDTYCIYLGKKGVMLFAANLQIIQEKKYVNVSVSEWQGWGGEEKRAQERGKIVEIDEPGDGYFCTILSLYILHYTILSTFLQAWNFSKEKEKKYTELVVENIPF